ncbi:hypothetical protein ANACOL_02798 [Anaerotruncus colihominis DSM 17241]|uniref:Uncharacterized protein n=1 Tax=Anaerotruncus colihominis DSM 17241 TaxID=445972 RepID=B0PE13_9FIRM|nr:hypothetical protein ANACOL_02798 [Anaerotruncus colihominis DSM 17241]
MAPEMGAMFLSLILSRYIFCQIKSYIIQKLPKYFYIANISLRIVHLYFDFF